MPQVFLDVETTQNSFCLKLHICLRFYNSHTYYSDYLLYINWGGLSPTQLKYAQNTLETSIKEIGPFFIADGVCSSNNIEPWWYHVPTARRPDYSEILDVSLNQLSREMLQNLSYFIWALRYTKSKVDF